MHQMIPANHEIMHVCPNICKPRPRCNALQFVISYLTSYNETGLHTIRWGPRLLTEIDQTNSATMEWIKKYIIEDLRVLNLIVIP